MDIYPRLIEKPVKTLNVRLNFIKDMNIGTLKCRIKLKQVNIFQLLSSLSNIRI